MKRSPPMPRYLMTLIADENAPVGAPPAELFQAIGVAAAEWQAKGVLVDTGGLAPTAAGTRLTLVDGEITAHPGPFAGPSGQASTAYAIVNASDQQDAV